MKTLVIFESVHSNTEEIARSIGSGIDGDVKVVQVGDVKPADLESLDLLIIGSPTQTGKPLSSIQNFIKNADESVIKGKKVAAFDTRLSTRVVKMLGYAAGKIGDNLKKRGGNLVAPPEAFFVKGLKGPLLDGEVERAAGWAKELAK